MSYAIPDRTFQQKLDRFKVNEDGFLEDTYLDLMWTLTTWEGSWSQNDGEGIRPSGTAFTEVLDAMNEARDQKIYPARIITHSRNVPDYIDIDPVANDPIIIAGENPPKYSDWRLPDVRELLMLHAQWNWVSHATDEAITNDRVVDDEDAWFWTNTLERTDKQEPSKLVYAVSSRRDQRYTETGHWRGEDDPPYSTDESPRMTEGSEYPVGFSQKQLSDPLQTFRVRLVRGEEKIHHHQDDA